MRPVPTQPTASACSVLRRSHLLVLAARCKRFTANVCSSSLAGTGRRASFKRAARSRQVASQTFAPRGEGRPRWDCHTYGTMSVDWEERVRVRPPARGATRARRRRCSPSRSSGRCCASTWSNIRYITATHIGTWAQDKLNRFCLLPQGDEPIMWDFGSAARHHQLYNPWLGDGRSRAGISTHARRDVAGVGPRRERRREDPRRARAARPARRAGRRRRGRAGGAVRAPGRGHRRGRRPAADAGGARDQDRGRDHACSTRPA